MVRIMILAVIIGQKIIKVSFMRMIRLKNHISKMKKAISKI